MKRQSRISVESTKRTQPSLLTPRVRVRWRAAAALAAILTYFLTAYVFLPLHWRRYEKRHPWLGDAPGLTHTKNGIPGDPLNVAIIGTEAELRRIMLDAQWRPADPLSLRSDLRIAADSVLERPYDDAPVSNLFFLRPSIVPFTSLIQVSPFTD